jgi:hypothetical protein
MSVLDARGLTVAQWRVAKKVTSRGLRACGAAGHVPDPPTASKRPSTLAAALRIRLGSRDQVASNDRR